MEVFGNFSSPLQSIPVIVLVYFMLQATSPTSVTPVWEGHWETVVQTNPCFVCILKWSSQVLPCKCVSGTEYPDLPFGRANSKFQCVLFSVPSKPVREENFASPQRTRDVCMINLCWVSQSIWLSLLSRKSEVLWVCRTPVSKKGFPPGNSTFPTGFMP